MEEDFRLKAKQLERRLLEARTSNERVDAFASVLRNSNTSSSSPSTSTLGDRSESLENVRLHEVDSINIPAPPLIIIQIPVTVNTRRPRPVVDEAVDPVDPFPLIVGVGLAGEKERRSLEKTVAKAASHLRAKHLFDTKELMVPSDTSTEVFNRGLTLHQTLCSASFHRVEGDEGRPEHQQRRSNDGYEVSEPQFPGVAFYRGVNERRPEWPPAETFYTPHQQQEPDSDVAGQLPWFALSPIVRMEPLLPAERRKMKTPEKGIGRGEHTPTDHPVYRTPPSRPISSTPVVSPARRSRPNSERSEEEGVMIEGQSGSLDQRSEDVTDHHELDVKIRELLERSGKKLRQAREIINRSLEESFRLQARDEAFRYRLEKNTVKMNNKATGRNQNVIQISPPRRAKATAADKVPVAKGVRSQEAESSIRSSSDSSDRHAVKQQLKVAIKERIEALKELARAQLYLTEEERLNSVHPADNGCKLQQRSSKIVEEYKRKKAQLKVALRTAEPDDGDDIKKLVAEHHMAIRVLHSETLAVQRRIKRLQEQRLLSGMVDRGVQVPTSREPTQLVRPDPLGRKAAVLREKSSIPTLNSAVEKLQSVRPLQQMSRSTRPSHLPTRAPVYAPTTESEVPRLDLHSLSESTYHSSQYASGSESSKQQRAIEPAAQMSLHFETGKPQWERREYETDALAFTNPPDSAKTSEGVSSIRDEFAALDDDASRVEWVPAERVLDASSRGGGGDEFDILPLKGVDMDSAQVEWVAAGAVVYSDQRSLNTGRQMVGLERDKRDSVAVQNGKRNTDYDASPLLSEHSVLASSLPLGSLVSPSPEPPEAKAEEIGRAERAAVDEEIEKDEEEEEEVQDDGSSPPPFSELDSTFETADDGMGGREEEEIDSDEIEGEDGVRSRLEPTSQNHHRNISIIVQDECPSESIEERVAGAEEQSFANEVMVEDGGSASVTPKAEPSRRSIEAKRQPGVASGGGLETAPSAEAHVASISARIEGGADSSSQASVRNGKEEEGSATDTETPSHSSSSTSPTYYSSSETPVNSPPTAEKGTNKRDDGNDVPPEPATALPAQVEGDENGKSGSISEEVVALHRLFSSSSSPFYTYSAPQISTAKASSSSKESGESAPAQESTSLAMEQKSPTDFSARMSKLNISSTSSTRDSTPRLSGILSRSASSRTPRSPTERYMARYPATASTSPRGPPNHIPPKSPDKGAGGVKKIPKRMDKAKAQSTDYFFACSSDEDSSASFKMLDELPNISSLTPILDISKNSLESPLRNSLTNAISVMTKEDVMVSTQTTAVRRLATGLAAESEEMVILTSPLLVSTSKSEMEVCEEEEHEEGSASPNLRDVDTVRRIVERESGRIWERLTGAGNAALEWMHPLAIEGLEESSVSDDYVKDFNLMIRDWCWELIRADLVAAGRRSRGKKRTFTSEMQIRSRLEREIVPIICLTSPHPRQQFLLPLDDELEVARSRRQAIKSRAERTSHLQLDERRLLAVQALYDEESTWFADELKGEELTVCEKLIALDDDEV